MHINPISYHRQRTQPNFQAKIRIVNDRTKEQIILDHNNGKYSINQELELLDKFDKFEPNKIISIVYDKAAGCQYRITNTSNNEIRYAGIQPLYDILTDLMKDTRENEVFWNGKEPRLFKHSVFIKA